MNQRKLFESTAVATQKRLKESFRADIASDRVDRAGGIIRDCAILGRDSANGRIYEDSALERAVELYEDCIVRVDHKPGEKRSILEDIGVLKNLRRDGDKVRGDFLFLKSHPRAEYFCERAERFPDSFGFSHEADGLVEDHDGKEHVVDLMYVESVDLVTNPATNRSLFEEKKIMGKTRKSIRSIVRSAPASTPGRKRMLEMIGDEAFDGDVEVQDTATPAQQLDLALKAAVQAILDNSELDLDSKLAAIQSLVAEPVTEEDGEEGEEKPTEEKPKEEPTVEEEEAAASADEKAKEETAMTEAVGKLRKEFSSKFSSQEKQIKELREHNDQLRTKAAAADNERAVRKLFEDSGVKAPTEDQLQTAMALSGRPRQSYVDTIKELVESRGEGGDVRSSGRGGESLGSYDSMRAEFDKKK